MANNMIGEHDILAEYKYKITEFYIIIDGEQDAFPVERISDFKIENYYEEATFPLFKVTCVMESSRYYKIMKNKDKVKFKLRVQSYYLKNGTQEQSLLRDFINDTFILFPSEADENYDEGLDRLTGSTDDRNELDALDNDIELFLFRDTIVTGLRSTFNSILSNVDMSTTVAYLLSKAGAKNVLMSPMENMTVYDTLLLPPQSIERQLKYLNNNFGFYKEGGVIFFGINNSYILNYKAGCTAYKDKEIQETVIYILDKANHYHYLQGQILKFIDNNGVIEPVEDKFYYSASSTAIGIHNNTITANAIGAGVDAAVVDMQHNSAETITSNAQAIEKRNTSVLFNNSSNKYLGTTYAAQANANSTVITLSVENHNLEAFYPNKKISFIFEDAKLNQKYKGEYRVASSIEIFTNHGEDYTCSSVLTFKKVK